ncbi:UNVERIFIED_CONTAM: hypothetical protein Sradi_7246200 [Sesamum radiatum]|uniref:Uncharacterized protein n=1 Tax=Sesamum radiatum TaxID=300843 RepID=A0AAW2ILH7_SESRA
MKTRRGKTRKSIKVLYVQNINCFSFNSEHCGSALSAARRSLVVGCGSLVVGRELTDSLTCLLVEVAGHYPLTTAGSRDRLNTWSQQACCSQRARAVAWSSSCSRSLFEEIASSLHAVISYDLRPGRLH